LFSREKRRLIPTREGEAFNPEAERLLDSIERIPEVVDEIKRSSRRQLKLIVMPRMAPAIAVPAVTEYLRRYDDTEVTVEVRQRIYLERWIANNQFDLGLGALPAGHAAIEAVKICSVPPVVVLHPQHRLADRTRISIQELEEEQIVLMPRSTLIGRQTARLFEDAGVSPKSRVKVSQTLIACSFAANGTAVAVTDAMIPQNFGDQVKLVPLDTSFRIDFGLLFPRGVKRSREIEPLIDIIIRQADAFAKRYKVV
jgi:DNA-binding transcriptional LysR family regulator